MTEKAFSEGKTEHKYRILHIRIRLDTKFQLKLTIWKITLSRVPMVVTHYIKRLCLGADRHNVILMPQILLVGETMKETFINLVLILNTKIIHKEI